MTGYTRQIGQSSGSRVKIVPASNEILHAAGNLALVNSSRHWSMIGSEENDVITSQLG